MKKENACYVCGEGELTQKKVDYRFLGVNVGKFDAEVCSKCGETFFDEDTSKRITQKTKELGLWGLEFKTKVGAVGTALDIRLNKRIIEFLKIKKGMEVTVYPESENSLRIEVS